MLDGLDLLKIFGCLSTIINKINVISRDKKTYIICLIDKIKQGDVFCVNKIRIFYFLNIETFKPHTEVLP